MKTMAFLFLVAGLWQMRGTAQDTPTPAPAAVYPLEDQWKARRDAAKHSKWEICTDLQMVAMEQGKALDLIPDLQSADQEKVNAAWTKIQAMLKTKDATLLAWPMVRSADGSRSVSESIVEKRYATEYEAPLPLKLEILAAATLEKPIVEEAIPTGFETRNTGATLEVEATVLDGGRRVHVELSPRRVELLAMEKNESRMHGGKMIVNEFQPLFATSNTNESLTVANEKYQLVAVHTLTKPEGWIELHLVRVRWAEAK